jgi:hypothetical protein
VLKELATDNEFESEVIRGQSRLRDLNHGKKGTTLATKK